MDSPTISGQSSWDWKRFGLKWLSVGAGIALVAAVAIGTLIWYSSRPSPPKQWDKTALVVQEPPGFSAVQDGKKLQFRYSVENRTNDDYQVESSYQVKVLIKNREGSFSQPLSDEIGHLKLPIFIPAKQTGSITLQLAVSGIPTQESTETDAAYHERVRGFCEDRLKEVSGFVLFDDLNKYQIDLPRWLSELPKQDHP